MAYLDRALAAWDVLLHVLTLARRRIISELWCIVLESCVLRINTRIIRKWLVQQCNPAGVYMVSALSLARVALKRNLS